MTPVTLIQHVSVSTYTKQHNNKFYKHSNQFQEAFQLTESQSRNFPNSVGLEP